MLRLRVVFAVIMLLIWMRQPLLIVISGGLAAVVICYQVPVPDAVGIIGRGAMAAEVISVALSFYLITLLQRILGMHGCLGQAEEMLSGIFHNRKVNASMAPAVIGLLPSAGALLISGAIVKNSRGDCMSDEDMTFTTGFFRHMPEGLLSTCASIPLTITLSGVNTTGFVFFTLPIVVALLGLGYLFMLRKLSARDKREGSASRRETWGRFVRGLWPIAFIMLLILVLDMPVYVAAPVGIVAGFLASRFSVREILPVFRSTFEPAIIGNTILVMIFKDVLAYMGVIEELPVVFSQLPSSPVAIFAMIFFVDTTVSNSQAIIVLCMPMVVTAVPTGGLPFVILPVCMAYAAMQVSPTHICLFTAVEYFGMQVGALIRRTLPVIAYFYAIASTYAYALQTVTK